MTDNPDMTVFRGDGADNALPPRLVLPGTTSDPARMARQILHAMLPGFADAAGVFVLEHLISGSGGPIESDGPTEPAAGAELVVRRLAAGSADDRLADGAALPPGQVIAFAAGTPFGRCVRDGAPVVFTQPGVAMLRQLPARAKAALAGYEWFVAAPMITRGITVGILVMARAAGAPSFSPADVRAAADLAARGGAAVAGSLSLMRHQSVAEALQRPQAVLSRMAPGQLEIAGRCLPAAGCDAGGDWYDIISLPGERTGLMVGDVMGHGPVAATVMTRLSAAAYTLADLNLEPAEVLRQLNRTALALPQETLATCVYAIIDPGSLSCDIAAAGHLPPVLALPDGTTRIPDMPGGQSLGISPASYGQARIRLRPGIILALYTDGMVETRTRSFDQGILSLRAALASRHQPLDAICEELSTAPGTGGEDDLTVVLARIRD